MLEHWDKIDIWGLNSSLPEDWYLRIQFHLASTSWGFNLRVQFYLARGLIFEGSIPPCQFLFRFFHMVFKFLKTPFLVIFCGSVNCMSWVFDFQDVQKLKHQIIFETFWYCYLWKVRFVLFVPIQTFFWSVNYTVLVYKLCFFFQTILELWALLIWEFIVVRY